MKKILFSFLILSLALFNACSSDDNTQDPLNGEEIDVVITADVPSIIGNSTKSAFASPYALPTLNSGKGGVRNVDPSTHKLRYILEITDPASLTTRQVQAVAIAGTSKATFTARLVKGATYNFVAWADFTEVATPEGDNHYITADLKAIKLKAGSAQIVNDDTKDAYFAFQDIVASTTIKMTLKRPFGKVRFITTDFKEFTDAGSELNSVAFKYSTTEQYTEFDATLGIVNLQAKTASGSFAEVKGLPIIVDDNNAPNEKTLYWDYLFAPTGNTPLGAKVAFNLQSFITPGTSFNTSIGSFAGATVERNKLTTIRQAIFTLNSKIELEVSDDFDGNIDLPTTLGLFSIGSTYYATIADALAVVKAGETINVAEGTFVGDFIIPAEVTVKGKGSTTVFTGQISLNAKSQLIDVKSYYNGNQRNAVEVRGENVLIDGVTFITDRVRGKAPAPYNGEAVHGDVSVKNLTVQNCTFNELGVSENYWKGIYLNVNNGLKVINNTFNNINPFGIDNFKEPMIVTGNTFQRNSLLGNTDMIHIADKNINGDGTDIAGWPAGLLQNVKDIKEFNTWAGSQLAPNLRCQPVRVGPSWYAGGLYDATWTFYK